MEAGASGNQTTRVGTRFARGMYYLFLGNVGSTFILAATAIVTGRILGPNGYGLYALVLVVPTYLQTLVQFGLPNAATRFPALYAAEGKHPKAVSFLYANVLADALIALVAILIILPISGTIATSLFERPVIASVIPIALVSVVGQTLYVNVTYGFQGLNRFDRSAATQILQAISKFLVTAALLFTGFALAGAAAGFSVGYLVSGVVGFLVLVKMNGGYLPRDFFHHVGVALRYSFPLYVAFLVESVVAPLQLTLLARFTNNSQIGGYGAALNIIALVSLLVYPISSTLFPLFSGLARDEGVLWDTYSAAVKYSSLLIVPASTLLIVFASPMVSAIYGSTFSFSGGFLVILASQYLLAGFGSLAQGVLLNSIGETRKALGVSLIGSISMLLVSVALIPFLSVYGAILATVSGTAISFGSAWYVIKKRLGKTLTMARGWRIYPASALAAVLVYPLSLLPLDSIGVALLGTTLYVLLLVPLISLTKAATKDEVLTMESYLHGIRLAGYLFHFIVRYYEFIDVHT